MCDTRDNALGEVLKSLGGFGLKGRMCNKGLDTETLDCGREGGFYDSKFSWYSSLTPGCVVTI